MSERPPRKPTTSLGEPASDGELRKHLAKARKGSRRRSHRKTIGNFEPADPDFPPTVFVRGGKGSQKASPSRGPGFQTSSTDVETLRDPQFEYVSDYDDEVLSPEVRVEFIDPVVVVSKNKSVKNLKSKPKKQPNSDLVDDGDNDDVFGAANLDYVTQITAQKNSEQSKTKKNSIRKSSRVVSSRIVTDIDNKGYDEDFGLRDLSLEATDANFHPIETSSLQGNMTSSDVENGARPRKIIRKKQTKLPGGKITNEWILEPSCAEFLQHTEDLSPATGTSPKHGLSAKPPKSSRRKMVEVDEKDIVTPDPVYFDLLSDHFCPNFIQLEAARDKNLILTPPEKTEETTKKRVKSKNVKKTDVNVEDFTGEPNRPTSYVDLVENKNMYIKTVLTSQKVEKTKSKPKKSKELKTNTYSNCGDLNLNRFGSVPTDLDYFQAASDSEDDTVNLVLQPTIKPKASKKLKNQTVVVYSIKEQFLQSNGLDTVLLDRSPASGRRGEIRNDNDDTTMDRSQPKRRSTRKKNSNGVNGGSVVPQTEPIDREMNERRTNGNNGSETNGKLNGTEAVVLKKSLARNVLRQKEEPKGKLDTGNRRNFDNNLYSFF